MNIVFFIPTEPFLPGKSQTLIVPTHTYRTPTSSVCAQLAANSPVLSLQPHWPSEWVEYTQLPQALCTRCALSAMPSLRRPHTQAPQRPPALPLPPPHPHWTVLLSSCSSFPTAVGPPKHVPCVPARAPADSTTGGVQRAGHRHQDNSRGSQSARREGSEPRLYARPRKVPTP